MLKLTVDRVFGTSELAPGEEVDLSNNGFELIYCEKNSIYSDKPIDTRRGFNEGIYPVEATK